MRGWVEGWCRLWIDVGEGLGTNVRRLTLLDGLLRWVCSQVHCVGACKEEIYMLKPAISINHSNLFQNDAIT